MSKKAQIQIFETIAVLMVFFILVAIGFIFYAKVIKGNLDIEREEASQIRSVSVAQKAMFLPELQCSEDNIITDNCVDVLKLPLAKAAMMENPNAYFDMLEFSEINISQIYPESPSLMNLNIYHKALDNFRVKYATNVPVSIYNPITKRYSFGVMTIETYSK